MFETLDTAAVHDFIYRGQAEHLSRDFNTVRFAIFAKGTTRIRLPARCRVLHVQSWSSRVVRMGKGNVARLSNSRRLDRSLGGDLSRRREICPTPHA